MWAFQYWPTDFERKEQFSFVLFIISRPHISLYHRLLCSCCHQKIMKCFKYINRLISNSVLAMCDVGTVLLDDVSSFLLVVTDCYTEIQFGIYELSYKAMYHRIFFYFVREHQESEREFIRSENTKKKKTK